MSVHDGLHLIPEHMRESAVWWAEKAEPAPELLASFFRAVLCNNLMEAAAHADEENARALHGWAMFLYNYMPGSAWGNLEQLRLWRERHHPKGVRP